MNEITSGCSLVFHVAAATNGSASHQRRVNIDGTRHVALAALQAGAQRLIHVSSIAVYGYGYHGIIGEDLPLQPHHDPYNVTKAAGEALLRDLGQTQGLPYTIIRPGMIYGPRSGMWTGILFRLARRRPTPWLGEGSGSAQPIHVDDVTEQMLIQATHPRAVGEAFHSTPDPSPSWREFIGAYQHLAGHAGWLALPPVLAAILAPVLEGFFRLRDEPKDLPEVIPYVQRRRIYSMAKARDLLGWSPKIDLQSGIETCVPWLREQGLLR
jgi:nucleoside-diphosphate-sugar epimerase